MKLQYTFTRDSRAWNDILCAELRVYEKEGDYFAKTKGNSLGRNILTITMQKSEPDPKWYGFNCQFDIAYYSDTSLKLSGKIVKALSGHGRRICDFRRIISVLRKLRAERVAHSSWLPGSTTPSYKGFWITRRGWRNADQYHAGQVAGFLPW